MALEDESPRQFDRCRLQARRIDLVVRRDPAARLAPRQPAIDFGAFDMLATTALAGHVRYFLQLQSPGPEDQKFPIFLVLVRLNRFF